MMTLIVGGSGSGKSEFAENHIVALAGTTQKYYLATMQVYDEEGQRKIERHRRLRAGKGFLTIEQPSDLAKAAAKMQPGEKGALLECMSNLVANEMFTEDGRRTEEEVAEKIAEEVAQLKAEIDPFVIVSNNVFEDGMEYEEGTMAYLRAIGAVNIALARMADEVIEVTAGIPVTIKGDK